MLDYQATDASNKRVVIKMEILEKLGRCRLCWILYNLRPVGILATLLPQFKTFFHVWKIIMKLTRFDCCMASCFYIDSEKNCLRSRIYHFRSFLLSCSCLFTTFTPFSCQTIHWWKLIRLFIPIQYSTASWRLKIAFSIFWQVTHGLMEKMSWKTHEYLNTFVYFKTTYYTSY